jgi:hypothetical protein
MPDLSEFFGSTSEVDAFKEKQKIVEGLDKTASPSEVRVKEIELFKPQDVLTFLKYEDVNTYFDAIKLYFSHKEYYLLFRKFFKVSEYLELNTYHIEPIVALLVALEKGHLKIEVDSDKITLKCEKPFELGVQNV